MKKRKGRATEAIALLEAALARRGLSNVKVVNNATEGALPDQPSLEVVPYLHYGAVGLNALEGYDAAIFIHGYYVPDDVLTETVFPHLPPSKRPKARITAKGGRRCITWTGAISEKDRRVAEVVLFRLEADPALQAFGRVRYTIHPRTVVMSIQHPIQSRVGRMTTVKNLGAARAALGLGGSVDERHEHLLARLKELLGQGQTLVAAAAALGVAYRTAKRLVDVAGVQMNAGRKGGTCKSSKAEKGPNPILELHRLDLAPFPPSADAPSAEALDGNASTGGAP